MPNNQQLFVVTCEIGAITFSLSVIPRFDSHGGFRTLKTGRVSRLPNRERLSDLLILESSSSTSVIHDVERLRAELRRIQCFLRDADNKQEQDKRVRNWVAEVRDVAYDIEDVIDTFIVRVSSSYVKAFRLRKLRTQIRIRGSLRENRYLVVLDDIWRIEAWNGIKVAFPKGKKGSKVVFTTRNKEVALSAPFLTFEKSWELLRAKAFPRDVVDERGCPSEFEKLGKEMVKICRGSPLAIVVLGGFFGRVEERAKKCEFNFPEEIPKRKLIRLWIAEGFVSTPNGGEVEEAIEDVAGEYLGELIDRCMVQESKRDYTGMGVKTCRVRDLMSDFCLSKAREDNFCEIVQHGMSMKTTARSRRIAIHLGQRLEYSALMFEQCDSTLPLKSKNFRLLRALELGFIRGTHPCQMPREIGKLIHLRYLGLKDAKIFNLPQSIGNLRNLHSLDLRNNEGIRIPKVVSRLTCLRHFLLPFGGYTLSSWTRSNFEWIN
ncbi:Disease resistance protein RPP13 [Morus notabilis]|uniref:Disease resistance protein RPP13 n=1 Tax=Morus notabilis TaxID=981085 RepID=W9QNV9_9ROSA|nr:Disease resistance protein RPP13 [Morus notabilis]